MMIYLGYLVGTTGIEPVTPTMSRGLSNTLRYTLKPYNIYRFSLFSFRYTGVNGAGTESEHSPLPAKHLAKHCQCAREQTARESLQLMSR